MSADEYGCLTHQVVYDATKPLRDNAECIKNGSGPCPAVMRVIELEKKNEDLMARLKMTAEVTKKLYEEMNR